MANTQREAAAALGITERQLRRWISEEGCPGRGADGTYNVAAIRTWRANALRAREKPESESSSLGQKIKAEQLRQLQLKTARMTAEMQRELGKLLPRKDYELFLSQTLAGLSDWLNQLPEILEGICCSNCRTKIPGRLRTELDRRRNELADALQRGPVHNE